MDTETLRLEIKVPKVVKQFIDYFGGNGHSEKDDQNKQDGQTTKYKLVEESIINEGKQYNDFFTHFHVKNPGERDFEIADTLLISGIEYQKLSPSVNLPNGEYKDPVGRKLVYAAFNRLKFDETLDDFLVVLNSNGEDAQISRERLETKYHTIDYLL